MFLLSTLVYVVEKRITHFVYILLGRNLKTENILIVKFEDRKYKRRRPNITSMSNSVEKYLASDHPPRHHSEQGDNLFLRFRRSSSG